MRTESETTDVERAALLSALRNANLSGPHLEIGTAAGGTLKELMTMYPEATRPRFVVVDPLKYFPGQKKSIDANLSGSGINPASVDFRITTSGDAYRSASASKESFSFIFIDAVHLADYVMQDLRWTTLLQVSGLVALHDHSRHYPGVVWAVRHFLKKNPNYKVVADAESLIVLRKISPSKRTEVRYIDQLMASAVAIPIHWKRMREKRRKLSTPRTA